MDFAGVERVAHDRFVSAVDLRQDDEALLDREGLGPIDDYLDELVERFEGQPVPTQTIIDLNMAGAQADRPAA